MKVVLQVISATRQGIEIPIKGPEFLIGRDPKCHLRPNSELVSKVHCIFAVIGHMVTLTDQGSTNGTFVNGKKISEPVTLQNGDEIQVGGLVFRIVIDLPAPAAAGGEDDVLDFLIDGDRPATANSTLVDFGGQATPDGDTRIDTFPLPPTDAPAEAAPPAEPEPAKKKDTHAAADDILKRLLNRPRS